MGLSFSTKYSGKWQRENVDLFLWHYYI